MIYKILFAFVIFVFSHTVRVRITEACPIIYDVQRGDTLYKLAQKFGTTIEELARLNKIEDINYIEAGAQLKIPCPSGQEDNLLEYV
jgi:LysM repeat protein